MGRWQVGRWAGGQVTVHFIRNFAYEHTRLPLPPAASNYASADALHRPLAAQR